MGGTRESTFDNTISLAGWCSILVFEKLNDFVTCYINNVSLPVTRLSNNEQIFHVNFIA